MVKQTPTSSRAIDMIKAVATLTPNKLPTLMPSNNKRQHSSQRTVGGSNKGGQTTDTAGSKEVEAMVGRFCQALGSCLIFDQWVVTTSR